MEAVDRVTTLLRPPERVRWPLEDPRDKWTRLTDSNLAGELAAAFPAATRDDFTWWEQSLDRWNHGYSQMPWWTPPRARELATARRLLNSARRVSFAEREARFTGDGIEYDAWFEQQKSRQDEGRRPPADVRAPILVPVALYDEGAKRGYVGNLILEPAAGSGRFCARHPTEAFVDFGESFAEGLADSMDGALNVVGQRSADGGVLWRAHTRDRERRRLEPDGRSASGAAGLALMLSLGGKVPDPGVLVIAEVSRTNTQELRPTDRAALPAKVEGVAIDFDAQSQRGDDDPIDTIVVVERDEKALAERVLAAHFHAQSPPRTSPIRVVVA